MYVNKMSYEEREVRMDSAPCQNGWCSLELWRNCPYKNTCPFEEEPDDGLDDYDPSEGRMGIDYSPSNPWDAPGMSVSDFIDCPISYF